MLNKYLFFIIASLILSSCHDMDARFEEAIRAQEQQKIADNAKLLFGEIDPEQDWVSITSGSVEVTADADLQNIVKVQILTESPFMNPDARVLNEAEATNGQTVTLSFDAPNSYTRLIAACVNKDGLYRFKGFNIGESSVQFQKAKTRAATRASEGDYNFPAASNFVLPLSKSFISYNAIRSQRADQGYTSDNIGLWQNSNWDNERMWRTNSDYRTNQSNYKVTYAGSDWYMQNFSIRRDIINSFDEDELAELKDIFNNYLYWSTDNKQKNNLVIIRKSKMFKEFNNHFIANGNPIILTPVQITSTDMNSCDVYYYYYDPAEVQGMTEEQEVQYIKDLPKFMAIAPGDIILDKKNGSDQFFKKSEYVLPYYGDAPSISATTLSNFHSDGNIYFIRNGKKYNDEDYYMIYNSGENNRLKTKLGDDALELPYQLWQIFTDDDDNCYLYNVGAGCFMHNLEKWKVTFTATNYLDSSTDPYTLDIKNGAYHFIAQKGDQRGKKLGSDLDPFKNTGIWSDKNTTNGTCDWYLEAYSGSRNFAVKKSIQKVDKEIVAQSFTIPAGYKIGFLLKKTMNNTDDVFNYYYNNSYQNKFNGNVYADGRLNTQINQFPDHFRGNGNKDVMVENDPRLALFSANGKMYMTFEDGSDANFVDMIVEVTNGVEVIEDTPEIEAALYTLSFEDRPNIADYDLNDVVLQCKRKDKTTLVLSLVAAGANDNVYIHGADGWAYNDKEVHEIFNKTEEDAAGNRFINTVKGDEQLPSVVGEVTVDEDVTIFDYLNGIYIENQTMRNTVKVASKGDPPFGIIIPIDFSYPEEKVSINNAYLEFVIWAQDRNSSKDWYKYPSQK